MNVIKNESRRDFIRTSATLGGGLLVAEGLEVDFNKIRIALVPPGMAYINSLLRH